MQSEGRRRAGAANSPALRYSVQEVVLPSSTVEQYREVGREWKGSGGQHRGFTGGFGCRARRVRVRAKHSGSETNLFFSPGDSVLR